MSYKESSKIHPHNHVCVDCNVKFTCVRNCEHSTQGIDHCYCPVCWLTKGKGQSLHWDLHWYEWGCWSSYTKEEIKYIETLEKL